uniref:MULE transposase domain-containing protein n=1 Tax=Lactuca sativa TaxID=4236 RepID=A0A9R1WNF4_LACSA|nr:hypothetical protein LSAT_V11C100032430 [Lactuca sativa]
MYIFIAMTSKFITLLCYWDGKICDGEEGITYNKSPNQAIKVQCGIQFNELIDQIHIATSIDKQQKPIKVICRYPSVVGKVMKYIPLSITDDNVIEIIFDACSLHQELSNIDLYLEVEVNGIKNHTETIVPTCCETFSIEQERDTTLSPTTIHTIGVSYMIQNEDFDMISQFAVVNNGMDCGFDMDNEEDEIDASVMGDVIKVPTSFTSLEGIDVANVDNWMMSQSENTNDLIQDLRENSVKSKEELIRATKLYTIKKRRQYEFIETCPTIWKIRCKITQDHLNLDASLIAQETEHLIKEQTSISVWLGKQKAIERVYGNWEESYIILPKFLTALQFFNPGTIVEWCTTRSIDVDQIEFRHVFWAFSPSINGFKYCRPVISIDAAHLYDKYKGKMMIAMGVMNESYSSWHWFLNHVKKNVVKEQEGICLISDCHSRILKVVNERGSPWLEPYSIHRYCLRHFVNNFNDKFRNSQLKVLAYRAGSQNQVRKFNSIMEEIGKSRLESED